MIDSGVSAEEKLFLGFEEKGALEAACGELIAVCRSAL